MKKLILASKSPRRRQLLANLGVLFDIIPSRAVEAEVTVNDPGQLVETLALRKAEAVASSMPDREERLVIGADTIVVLDGTILGKPKNDQEAAAMLRRLSGNWHQFTGGCFCTSPQLRCPEQTAVKISQLMEEITLWPRGTAR